MYYEKNYHWYQKQTINYTKENYILHTTWSSEKGKDLLILSPQGCSVYTFSWTISQSQGKDISDKSTVTVVDGNKVLVTCFKDGIVPPPMAQQTLEFKKPVNAVSFAPSHVSDCCSNDFLALLSNNKIVHCKHSNVRTKMKSLFFFYFNFLLLKFFNEKNFYFSPGILGNTIYIFKNIQLKFIIVNKKPEKIFNSLGTTFILV